MGGELTWNRDAPRTSYEASMLGQVRRVQKELTTIEKISIVSITVSVASLLWSVYTYTNRKKC